MQDHADERIVRLLAEHGVPFRVHEHTVARTVADAQERLPFPRERFLKTVAFRVKNGPWVLAALRGQDRVDYRKLAAALGVRRGDLLQPAPGEVEEALGFAVGGVCPIPPNADAETVVDRGAADLGTVYCGIGRADRTLEIGLTDLVTVARARVLPIAQEPPP